MSQTALVTQRDISFISTHLSAEHCVAPTSEDGQLLVSLHATRDEKHAQITSFGQQLFAALEQSADISAYLGVYRMNAPAGSENHHPGTVEHSVKLLDCTLWQRFFDSSQMVSVLPTRLAQEFRNKISCRDVPPFTPEHTLPTIKTWFESQYRFIAERIDGVFHALSPDHITNSPAGFGKKMIMKNATGLKSKSSVSSHIDDLRIAIAALEGRCNWVEKSGLSTEKVLSSLHRKGQFDVDCELDGGAIVLRIFKVGTVHLHIHPDVAYKLNDILAMLYPAAIPAKFRKAPAVRERFFKEKINHTLPVTLLSPVIGALSKAIGRRQDWHFLDLMGHDLPEHAHVFSINKKTELHPEFSSLMQALRATRLGQHVNKQESAVWMVDYDPREVALVLAQNGQIPDKKSHQFYPSVGAVAQDAATWLLEEHRAGLSYCEPSVGQGDLLKLLPHDARITAVEISGFQLAIAQGVRPGATFSCLDFAEFASNCINTGKTFDRILMNPPYTNGQAQYHTALAAQLLVAGGSLVAILPETLRGTEFDGCTAQRSATYTGAFDDANVRVFILKLTKN